MTEDEAKQLLEYIPQKERDSYDAADFAGPDRSFPITTQAQLDAAAHLIGHAANPAAVKAKAIRIAKRKGFTLPASWQKEEEANPSDLDGEMTGPKKQKQESAATITNAVERPRKKIATLRVCFLEYNARSLNGRIYPKATCDAIYESGQRKLANPNSLPITVFVSHEAANGNVNTELVGRVSRLWQEASKFYADLDLADTRTAWDMLALAEGQYLRSESMRVLGVDLKHDRSYDLPLVIPQEGVENVELMGIDLTTRPGLIDSARILQTLYESTASQEPYTETFTLDTVLIEKEAPMSIPLYLQVLLQEGLTSDRQAHQKIHDHLAGVMDATIANRHGSESARLIAAVEGELDEAGRMIAKQHATHLAKAHDIAAHQLGIECEGAYNSDLGIGLSPDKDGDNIPDNVDDADKDDDGESSNHPSSKGVEEEMTPQEMMEALKAAGYNVEPPKSKEQELQEAFDAKLAEQERKFNERLQALTESNPGRQTQTLDGLNEGNNEFAPEQMYMEGDYLAGKLHPKNWKQLARRDVPWPQDVDPEYALGELAQFMEFQILESLEAARGRSLRQMIADGTVA